jgi:hypothetical protein
MLSISMISVFNCGRRPSSKARQSLKLSTLTHNVVSLEEENVIGDNVYNDKNEQLLRDDDTIIKCFRCAKKANLR